MKKKKERRRIAIELRATDERSKVVNKRKVLESERNFKLIIYNTYYKPVDDT